jgi:hypothetical protein
MAEHPMSQINDIVSRKIMCDEISAAPAGAAICVLINDEPRDSPYFIRIFKHRAPVQILLFMLTRVFKHLSEA